MDIVDNANPEMTYRKNHAVGQVSLALKESCLCDREYSNVSSSIRGGCRISLQNEVARDTRRGRFCLCQTELLTSKILCDSLYIFIRLL